MAASKTLRVMKQLFVLFLSLNLVSAPAFAASTGGMISTSTVVDDLTREQMQRQIQQNIQATEIGQRLKDRGVSESEVSARLATLSDTELRQLASQTQEARYGGDILIAILVVVLIIFLIKRM
jgi:hypothetical protein